MKRFHASGICDCCDAPQLFDVDQLAPRACPVGHCQAIRTGPDQARVPTCAHDLDPDRKHRPKGCLNEYRPDDTEIPY